MYFKSRSIIIKTSDYRDTDKLVTIFSENKGKIRAIAKGIKKPNSSLRACVQPFAHSLLFVSSSQELGLITQGKVLDFYGNIRDEFSLSLNAIYLMELLDKALMDNVPLKNLYNVTLQVLSLLNKYGNNPLIIRYYELFFLKELGYMPVLNECVVCGSSKGLNYLSISEGGIVCEICSRKTQNNLWLSGEAMAVLRLLSTTNINTLNKLKVTDSGLRQIELALEKYLEYYLERKLKAKDTIKKIKMRLSFPN